MSAPERIEDMGVRELARAAGIAPSTASRVKLGQTDKLDMVTAKAVLPFLSECPCCGGNLLSPSPLSAALVLPEVRMQLFLYVLREAGGRADCSEDPGEWVAAFCDDRGRDTDTFNRAADEGLITVWHNDISESSRCEITDKGRAAIAAIKESSDG